MMHPRRHTAIQINTCACTTYHPGFCAGFIQIWQQIFPWQQQAEVGADLSWMISRESPSWLLIQTISSLNSIAISLAKISDACENSHTLSDSVETWKCNNLWTERLQNLHVFLLICVCIIFTLFNCFSNNGRTQYRECRYLNLIPAASENELVFINSMEEMEIQQKNRDCAWKIFIIYSITYRCCSLAIIIMAPWL